MGFNNFQCIQNLMKFSRSIH